MGMIGLEILFSIQFIFQNSKPLCAHHEMFVLKTQEERVPYKTMIYLIWTCF